VVTIGDALVVAAFGADNPVVGDQLYVWFAVVVPESVTLPPGQIEEFAGVTVNVGAAFTVMSRVPVSVHPLASVPVTV
jgi:hypothetical protein